VWTQVVEEPLDRPATQAVDDTLQVPPEVGVQNVMEKASTVEPLHLRACLSRFATGVVVVSYRAEG